MRKVSTTCPSLNVMDLLKCLFIVSNNTSTNLMSKLPCLRLWTDASRINMKQSNKDLKTETKHSKVKQLNFYFWRCEHCSHGRSSGEGLELCFRCTKDCDTVRSIFIPFSSIFHPELMDFGRLYMALLRSCSSDCSVTVPRKWMRDVFMSDDFSTFFRWNEDPVRSDFQSWRRLAKVLEVEALFLSNSHAWKQLFPEFLGWSLFFSSAFYWNWVHLLKGNRYLK